MSVDKILEFNFDIKTEVKYVESESHPDSDLHFFSYKIFITNLGAESAQLMSRHWIITDNNGNVEEIRGAGVVGQQPRINPGQTFHYESSCPMITSSGSMKGTYQFVGKNGHSFEVIIPEFYLVAPSALH